MYDDISQRLQQVRQMYGLSQRELAKRAGVTNSSVSMIEQGRVSPSISSLEKLLKGIPMTLRDFFNLDLEIESKSYFRSFEIYRGSDNGIDTYTLEDEQSPGSQLFYQVFNPGSDTGEAMAIAKEDANGFVVDGQLEVTINNQCEVLDAGDGFAIKALLPYRFRNFSKHKAIIVLNYYKSI